MMTKPHQLLIVIFLAVFMLVGRSVRAESFLKNCIHGLSAISYFVMEESGGGAISNSKAEKLKRKLREKKQREFNLATLSADELIEVFEETHPENEILRERIIFEMAFRIETKRPRDFSPYVRVHLKDHLSKTGLASKKDSPRPPMTEDEKRLEAKLFQLVRSQSLEDRILFVRGIFLLHKYWVDGESEIRRFAVQSAFFDELHELASQEDMPPSYRVLSALLAFRDGHLKDSGLLSYVLTSAKHTPGKGFLSVEIFHQATELQNKLRFLLKNEEDLQEHGLLEYYTRQDLENFIDALDVFKEYQAFDENGPDF